MKKLPQPKSLTSQIRDLLTDMKVGSIETYHTDNRNYTSFKQMLYKEINKMPNGEWITKINYEENLLMIIRIK